MIIRYDITDRFEGDLGNTEFVTLAVLPNDEFIAFIDDESFAQFEYKQYNGNYQNLVRDNYARYQGTNPHERWNNRNNP